MIIKKDNYKIKHQSNTNIYFLDRDNIIQRKIKPIMKLNSKPTQI
jgi:hypothetical protein